MIQVANAAFASGKTRPIEFREKQLKNLLRMYEENTNAFVNALGQDLHKSKQEAIIMEVALMINDVKNTLANLREWTKPEKVCRL